MKTGGMMKTLHDNQLRTDGVPDRISALAFLRYLLNAAWPFRFVYLGILLLMIASAAAGYIQPLLQKKLINILTSDGAAKEGVWAVFIWTGVLYGFIRVENSIQMYAVNSTVQKVMYRLKSRIMAKLLELPVGLLNQLGGGYLAGRLNSDLTQIQLFFSNILFSMILNVLQVIGGLVLLFILNWKVGLATLLIFPLYLLLLMHFRGKHYRLSKQMSEERAKNQRMVSNSIVSISMVKSHAAEDKVNSKIRSGFARETVFRLESVKVANIFLFLSNMIPMLSQGILATVGVYLILRGNWTLGMLWALHCYMNNVFSPLGSLCSSYLTYQTALAGAVRLIELEQHTSEPHIEGGISDFELKGKVEIRDLDFGYHGRNDVLKQANLRVNPGEHLVIMGASGSGKSTLFALLLGFFRPSGGKILIDDIDLTDYNMKVLRRKIGYIGATGDFIHGTIRENLLIGCRIRPDDAQIMEALNASGADFIQALPEGIDTVLQEARTNFSFGEQLRLSLARELLRGCDLLLIDEATANLDRANETNFLETVFRVFEGKTILMIRHTSHPLTDSLPHVELKDGKFELKSTAF